MKTQKVEEVVSCFAVENKDVKMYLFILSYSALVPSDRVHMVPDKP